MAVPTLQEITRFVMVVLDTWRTRAVEKLAYDQDLKDRLGIVEVGLRTLSGALRSYIQNYKNSETLTVPDLVKAKTVGGTTALVIKRITGEVPSEADLTALIDQEAP